VTIAEYLNELKRNLAQGDATEHTHRFALKSLMESFAAGIVATNEPVRKTDCGAPDFSVSRKTVPLGYIETKDIGIDSKLLDEMERGRGANGEQFKRYRDGLPNWILTDYLDFRWYVGGEKRFSARIARLDGKGKLHPEPDGDENFRHLVEAFLSEPALTIESAKDLAQRMAGMARILRTLIANTFQHGQANEQRWLGEWLAAFRGVLIPDLSAEQFADMFAQTLAYGLFAARVHTLNSDKPFTREMAAHYLPRTNPFLRKLFSEIAGVDMPETFAWAVDGIVHLLRHTEWGKVLREFGKGKSKHDPVVHFYETFLGAYDPKMRELRGVYYTPEPVVSYIVRSVDKLLESHFGKPQGLADEKTLILDPAVGTATFLYFVIQQIAERFEKQKGAWDGYVSEHLLNRIFGFELLMAPYAMAHLKLGMELQETGYTFASDQRLGIYLTNTLEEAEKKSEKLFAQWISDEANAAAEIKRDKPILVVLGNPPYSGHSANKSRDESGELTFIGDLIEDYKKVDGAPLGEKNPKWLQDDYVKFIRFAQWRIERSGHGILAFITNNGYLDNPTFRGMRQSLLESFDLIHVYNLHGSTKKMEVAPDGGEDANVFDIQQGVAILIAVKRLEVSRQRRVLYADLWGPREYKYGELNQADIASTAWTELLPNSPQYLLVRQDTKVLEEYEKGWRLPDMMPVNVLGFQSHRDAFAVAFTEGELQERILTVKSAESDDEVRGRFLLSDGHDWKLIDARRRLRELENWQKPIIPCLYRPIDFRFCYMSDIIMDRPRRELLEHVAWRANICLGVGRQGLAVNDSEWSLVTISADPVDANIFRRGGINVFPLYLFDNGSEKQARFNPVGRRLNFSESFLTALSERLGLGRDGQSGLPTGIVAEEIVRYTYAILHSKNYRARYGEFLRNDFPRIPLTSDLALFRSMAEKGSELILLHLMESPKLDDFFTEFPVKGDNTVEKAAYTEPNQRVWINGQQYFGEVPREIWEFRIGGYQVLEKWLKDRKGRKLMYDDIRHWQRVALALRETMRVMQEIDAIIPGWPLP
jgi:predicted helicase